MAAPVTDPAVAFPADEFICIPHVAIMDAHSAEETHGGGKGDVTDDDLAEMAEGINYHWRTTGDASRIVLGHTPSGHTPFTKSSGVGWAINGVVDDFFDTGRKGLFADFYIKRKYADVVEKYPRRSIEYWPKTRTVDPVALLDDETPERFLGIIRYDRDGEHHTLSMSNPPPPTSSPMPDDKTADLMKDAVTGETASSKGVEAKLDALTDSVGRLSQMFEQLLSMVDADGGEGGQGNEGDDLLGPADDGGDFDDEGAGDDKDAEKPPKKDAKKPKDDGDDEDDAEPEKYEAACAGPNNTYTPSAEEKKKKMSRTDTDDRAQYKRDVAAEVERQTAAMKKEHEQLVKYAARMKAEKAVAELESAPHSIDFGDFREKETDFFADLIVIDRTEASFKTHFDNVAKKYRRKPDPTPDAAGVDAALRYSRTGDPDASLKSAAEVEAFVNAKYADPALTLDAFKARLRGTK